MLYLARVGIETRRSPKVISAEIEYLVLKVCKHEYLSVRWCTTYFYVDTQVAEVT